MVTLLLAMGTAHSRRKSVHFRSAPSPLEDEVRKLILSDFWPEAPPGPSLDLKLPPPVNLERLPAENLWSPAPEKLERVTCAVNFSICEACFIAAASCLRDNSELLGPVHCSAVQSPQLPRESERCTPCRRRSRISKPTLYLDRPSASSTSTASAMAAASFLLR